jgi:zinc transport system substrate-binding protein
MQQIGKDLVDVQVMVHPGADPHTYEPKPQQMVAITKTKLYFAVGIEFEKANLSKIAATNPDLKVIHTDHGIDKLAMEAHHHHHDDHAEEHHDTDHHETEKDHENGEHHGDTEHDHKKGEHHGDADHDKEHNEHAGLDPHIWLSPPLVKIQARTILAALQEADPQHRSVYEANFKAFTAQIDKLDADL